MTEVFNLDRAQAEENRIDALGKKWVIKVNKQNGLCHARPEPDREDAVIPKQFTGQWTKPSLLMEQIALYIKRTWDHAEELTLRKERAAQAAKEQEKRDAEAQATAAREEAAEDQNEESTGRPEDAGSEEEKEEEVKKVTKKKAKKKTAK